MKSKNHIKVRNKRHYGVYTIVGCNCEGPQHIVIMDEKLRDYKERHIRWQDFSISQLGYTNNIILTLGMGFLAFAFDKEFSSTLSCSRDSVSIWKMFFYVTTIISLLFSISFGVLTSISRLYDFRITRHIAITRQRFYDKYKNKPLPTFDFPKPNCKQRRNALCWILFKPIDLIERKEITDLLTNSKLEQKFNDLRELAETLGIITWCFLKSQFLFLVISLILYSINLFI